MQTFPKNVQELAVGLPGYVLPVRYVIPRRCSACWIRSEVGSLFSCPSLALSEIEGHTRISELSGHSFQTVLQE